jgi:phosphatidylserine/phosphatidylglycerophosphate/cardiolipin synthase-like enzyme
MEVYKLTDGGQRAEDVARTVAEFVLGSRDSLDLALYDVRLPDAAGELVAGALREVAARGVGVRLLYNHDSSRPAELHPPPATRPEILAELPIDARPVPGIPDLMHHKYAVRDDAAVLTGSANWTVDSWTRQENVLIAIDSEPVAGAYAANFAELWEHRDVERSGRVEPRPFELAGGAIARA